MGKVLLKGKIASPGIAKGKVRIILDSANCHLMNKGDILVTEMTDPLYILAIGKAAAIITNIGGLLCHAAITARELGIPCLVNTKNATGILKDNQGIVVDAVKGLVYEE